jgi:Uma2 family endonuclease
MYRSYYSENPTKISRDWKEQTLELLRHVFLDKEIKRNARFRELPRVIIDFYVPSARIAVECRACGLTSAQDRVLVNHKCRQDVLKSLGITYVWWVDRERTKVVPKNREYLENVFYNCLGEKREFINFLICQKNKLKRI